MATEDAQVREIISRPVTDPTVLTTAALLREVTNLKEQSRDQLTAEIKVINAEIQAVRKEIDKAQADYTRVPTELQKAVGNLQALHDERFSGLDRDLKLGREVIVTRFDAMDRALKLLQDISDRFPERIDEKIASLKEIHDGQITGIQTQLRERDAKVAETALATKTAVDAALSAAEKATSKQAESFSEAADKQAAAFTKAIDQQRELSMTEIRALRDICATLDRRLTTIESMNLGGQTAQRETHSASTLIIAIIAVIFAALSAAAAWVHTALR